MRNSGHSIFDRDVRRAQVPDRNVTLSPNFLFTSIDLQNTRFDSKHCFGTAKLCMTLFDVEVPVQEVASSQRTEQLVSGK